MILTKYNITVQSFAATKPESHPAYGYPIAKTMAIRRDKNEWVCDHMPSGFAVPTRFTWQYTAVLCCLACEGRITKTGKPKKKTAYGIKKYCKYLIDSETAEGIPMSFNDWRCRNE